MVIFNSKIIELPTEEQKWLLSFELFLRLSQNYDNKQFESLIVDIERKAFKKGYLDVVLLLDSIDN